MTKRKKNNNKRFSRNNNNYKLNYYYQVFDRYVVFILRYALCFILIFGAVYVISRETLLIWGVHSQAVIYWRGDVHQGKHSVDKFKYYFFVDGKKYVGDMYYDERYSIGDTIRIKYVNKYPDWNRVQK